MRRRPGNLIAPTRMIMLALIGLILWGAVSCQQGGKKIRLRFKYHPELTLTYRQTSRGIVQGRRDDSLWYDSYVDETINVDYYTRAVNSAGVAEFEVSSKFGSKEISHLPSDEKHDTVVNEATKMPVTIEYVRPNGSFVDMTWSCDTVSHDLSYLRKYYEQSMIVFPDYEVTPGQSWTHSTTVILPDGPVETSTTYTVKSFARERAYDCIIVAFEGTSVVPLTPNKAIPLSVVSGVDRITFSGHVYFAYREGMIVLKRERWLFDGDHLLMDTLGNYIDSRVVAEKDIDLVLIRKTQTAPN